MATTSWFEWSDEKQDWVESCDGASNKTGYGSCEFSNGEYRITTSVSESVGKPINESKIMLVMSEAIDRRTGEYREHKEFRATSLERSRNGLCEKADSPEPATRKF